MPSPGVITAWSFQANAAPPQLKFKVGRSAGANAYRIVGESGVQTPIANSLNTYDVRIPVQTGDVIGHYTVTAGGCLDLVADAGTTAAFIAGDVPPGSTATFGSADQRLDVSARLEADADGDGFGDESQDECPTDPTRQSACAAPPPPPANQCTINGTSGNDVIRGTAGRDVICAGGGNDVVHGLGGDDIILGQGGNDALRGQAGNDRLSGGPGNDSLVGGPSNDSLSGGPGNDSLTGSSGNDSLVGGPGNDSANGGPGNDSCPADRRDARRSC